MDLNLYLKQPKEVVGGVAKPLSIHGQESGTRVTGHTGHKVTGAQLQKYCKLCPAEHIESTLRNGR